MLKKEYYKNSEFYIFEDVNNHEILKFNYHINPGLLLRAVGIISYMQ